MNPSINARLQRGYQLSRRLRRFVRDEQALRSPWGPSPRLGVALLADGFHRDKLELYPGIEDPVTRASYVSDLTTQRVRMFNGKSGELLTRKDVLLKVLERRLGWHLNHRIIDIPKDHPEPRSVVADQLGSATGSLMAILRHLDTAAPRVLDDHALTDPEFVPYRRCVLLWLAPSTTQQLSSSPRVLGSAGTSDTDNGRRDSLRLADRDPLTVVQFATYWDATEPFLGYMVAMRGGNLAHPGWPQVGPELEVDQLDPQHGQPIAGVRITTDSRGRLLRRVRPPGLSLPEAAIRQTAGELLRVARRFPNLRAINWSFLVADDHLMFINAENRLDVVFPQLFGPLLADPRLHAVYVDAGMSQHRRLRA